MPFPTPNSGESEDDFVGRCMSNETMKKEFPEQKQRLAVCYKQFRRDLISSEPIPILRSFESGGKKYVYGYAAIFDSPDAFGTVMSRGVVESSLPHLKKFPATRFMHREPFAQIVFDREVEGVKTFVDEHGFHVLCEVYDHKENEWNMVTRGGWGFSFGFMPNPNTNGFEVRKAPDGRMLPHFANGHIYEVSVVDTPAHEDAVAYAMRRIQGDTGGNVTSSNKIEEIKMNEEEMKALEKRIGDIIDAKLKTRQTEFNAEEYGKEMEKRLTEHIDVKMKELAPKPEPTQLDNTVANVKERIAGIEKKLGVLRKSATDMKAMGENVKSVEERIVQLETEKKSFEDSIVKVVGTEIQRHVVTLEKRMQAIEDTPEFHSPASTGSGIPITRGYGQGLRGMLEAAFPEQEGET